MKSKQQLTKITTWTTIPAALAALGIAPDMMAELIDMGLLAYRIRRGRAWVKTADGVSIAL